MGETVRLTVKPASLPSPTWSITGTPGTSALDKMTGPEVTLEAGERACMPTVKAEVSGKTVSVDFNVIEPSSVAIVKTSGTANATPRLSIQMEADWYIGPEDVNFQKIQIAEQHVPASANGYFSGENLADHNPGADCSPTDQLTPGKGWLCDGGADLIQGGASAGPPYTPGFSHGLSLGIIR